MNRFMSVRTSKVLRLLIFASLTAAILGGATTLSHARIIDAVTEELSTARVLDYSKAKGGTSCNRLDEITSPVRAGAKAFLHWVDRCGERSELSLDKTEIGGTYWYGWSMLIPDQELSDSYDILAQWMAYPTPRRMECGAAGSYMIRSGNNVTLKLQRQGERSDIECDEFPIAEISDIRGKWVDYVMQAKWTGNSDGFLKMWVKVGNGEYVQKVNYNGRTFWNDEDTGPYMKLGLYKGDPGWSGNAPQRIYTDEYRLGDTSSSFSEVAPGGGSTPPIQRPIPQPGSKLIAENFDSINNLEIKAGGWSVQDSKLLLNNPNEVPTPAMGNIAVHRQEVTGDFELSAIASTSTPGGYADFALIVNYDAPDYYQYVVFHESGDSKLQGVFEVADGKVRQLATFDNTQIEDGRQYQIKLVKEPNRLDVYLNGKQVGTARTSFMKGKVGFATKNNAATFDNLSVTQN